MSSAPPSDLHHAVAVVATLRRIIVDHVVTGLAHPDPAVVRQARALATEMDAAGMNIDLEVDAAAVAQ